MDQFGVVQDGTTTKMPHLGWQAYYAVFRVWKYHLKGASSQVMGELLLTLLKGANTPAAKITVINGLFRHWIPKAENPIAELLQDSSE
ncbi:unnamed protein product, partial [marine sediment metagenome]